MYKLNLTQIRWILTNTKVTRVWKVISKKTLQIWTNCKTKRQNRRIIWHTINKNIRRQTQTLRLTSKLDKTNFSSKSLFHRPLSPSSIWTSRNSWYKDLETQLTKNTSRPSLIHKGLINKYYGIVSKDLTELRFWGIETPLLTFSTTSPCSRLTLTTNPRQLFLKTKILWTQVTN